jgi:hypothetical protein
MCRTSAIQQYYPIQPLVQVPLRCSFSVPNPEFCAAAEINNALGDQHRPSCQGREATKPNNLRIINANSFYQWLKLE